MKCPKCKNKLRKGAKFCPACGAKIQKKTGHRVISIILIIALLVSIVAVGWTVGILIARYTAGGKSLFNFFGNKSDVKINSAEEAIEHATELGKELGYENALSELTEKNTTTIDGDTYYRLQQNYQGIPVYGRNIVYVTDTENNVITVTGNVQDVDKDVSLTPTATEDQISATIKEYLTGLLGYTVNDDIKLEVDDLCLYNMDSSSGYCLSYCVSVDSYEFIVDAHSGNILSAFQTIFEDNKESTTGYKGSDVRQENGFPIEKWGEYYYVMSDASRNLIVYTFNYRSSDTDSGFNRSGATLVESVDNIFGNTEAESALEYEKGATLLQNVIFIHDYYSSLNFVPFVDDVRLYYNDAYDNGENARGGIVYGAGVVSMGWDTGVECIDLIAHEYTHYVSRNIVNWNGSDETDAMNEAMSDLFGELVEASFDAKNTREPANPDWKNRYRNMIDPTNNEYPAKVTDPNNSGEDFAHGYSTVITHAAYLMWNGGIDNNSSKKIPTDSLAKLWYRAMLMMPSDCDFIECRTLVELAASTMNLTASQIQCVCEAFDEVGIPRASADEYSQLVHLVVNGNTSIKGTVHEVKTVDGLETVVPVSKATMTVYSSDSNKVYKEFDIENADGFFEIELSAGTYSVVVSAEGYIGETIAFELAENEVRYLSIKLEPQSSGAGTEAYEAYLSAAKKTTESGSWSENLSMTADMSISDGSSKTKTKITMTSDAAISNYSESDLSKIQISGSANMSAMGQTYAWTMEYKNGTAHYQYTEPSQTSSDLKIDPSFFNFNTMTSDMMTNAKISGNQITFTVPGEKITEVGLAAVNQMSGVDDLEYGDVDVAVQLSTEGKIDTITMTFHASMEYQGYDAEVDYIIHYGFSEYSAQSDFSSVSITPGTYAQEDNVYNTLTIHEVNRNKITFTTWWYRIWDISKVEATLNGNVASFEYMASNNESLRAKGSITFQNDTAVLTLTECTQPYVDTGEYRFNLVGIKFSDEQLKEISYALGVPENLDTQITQGEPAYWEGGDMYRTSIEVYYNGELVAGASVNSLTGDLAGNIYMYDTASNSGSNIDMASTFGFSKAWDIHDRSGTEHMVTSLAFQEDGTFCCAVGWYLSEWYVSFKGTYRVDNDEIILRYTLDGEDKMTSYQIKWDDQTLKQTSEENLVIAHQKGSEYPFEENPWYTADELMNQVELFMNFTGFDG